MHESLTTAFSECKGQPHLMTLHQCYAGMLLREAVLGSEQPTSEVAQANGTNQNVLSFVASWYTDVAARDVRNLGSSIAPSK